MVGQEFTPEITELRRRVASSTRDARALHDDIQVVMSRMQAQRKTIPNDLRLAAESLEAEIVEEFYDNLPV